MRTPAILLVMALLASPLAGQRASKEPPAQKLPPLSYICPMPGDEDVVEDKGGVCPKCGMDLIPARLDTVWTCATRPLLVVQPAPGRCPVDGSPLVQMTVSVTWTCKAQPSVSELQPGKCADGTPMIRKYSQRAHGNHNPQHGGLFFMAPDNWHHLEGTYLPNGVFRLYLYDDFTKALPLAEVREVTARVVTKQTFDAATRTTKEIAAMPLVGKGRYVEASVGAMPFPAQMTAKVAFKRGDPEHVFDFTFESFSKDPAAPPRATVARPTTPAVAAEPARSALPAPAATIATAPEPISTIDSGLAPMPIPATVPEMVAQLRTRRDEIRTFIDRGSFASVYVPAFQAKDLALALDEHKSELPPARQTVAEPAIARLVRAAYLLDAFGDLGNKQQIVEAYELFSGALKDIEASFPNR